MTTPQPVADLSDIIPKKWKPVVGLIGSLLTFIVPAVISAESSLPPIWSVIIAGVLAVLTAFGIYKAPYTPEGTIVAPATPEVVAAATQQPVELPPATPDNPVAPGPIQPLPPHFDYKNPWKK